MHKEYSYSIYVTIYDSLFVVIIATTVRYVTLFLVFCRLEGTKFEIITQNEEQVEISFTRTWTISKRGSLVPLNVDKR